MRNLHAAAASEDMAKPLLSLRNSPFLHGTPGAFHCLNMITVNPICPISTRPAYYGARRIAPVAATSRFEAWGARPAVEELRPARPKSRLDETLSPTDISVATAAYVTHMLGQFQPQEPVCARSVARRYIAADELGGQDPRLHVASL
jgi:hypothetical protein